MLPLIMKLLSVTVFCAFETNLQTACNLIESTLILNPSKSESDAFD